MRHSHQYFMLRVSHSFNIGVLLVPRVQRHSCTVGIECARKRAQVPDVLDQAVEKDADTNAIAMARSRVIVLVASGHRLGRSNSALTMVQTPFVHHATKWTTAGGAMGGAKVRETSTVFVVQRFACADSKKHPPHLHTANEVACQWHRRFPDAKNDNGRNCAASPAQEPSFETAEDAVQSITRSSDARTSSERMAVSAPLALTFSSVPTPPAMSLVGARFSRNNTGFVCTKNATYVGCRPPRGKHGAESEG
ncbi:hypothetical protein BJV77DRAFT_965537 [Russula vinacea]|nr:hypothetical protein BJV77DRAFT_965537 [Russula vinacea]